MAKLLAVSRSKNFFSRIVQDEAIRLDRGEDPEHRDIEKRIENMETGQEEPPAKRRRFGAGPSSSDNSWTLPDELAEYFNESTKKILVRQRLTRVYNRSNFNSNECC